MAGYTRNDTVNNIADGNIINASDLDGEFDALQGAFSSTTGHVHDGTSGNGAPILKVGPVQDLTISGTAVLPKTDNTLDLGSSSLEFKDLFIDGTANIDTLIADTATISAGTITGITDLAIADGGTGASTQQTAINALAGATTSGQFLRGNGTNVSMSTIQAADVPTLNQNTTGTAVNVTGTVAVANGGTGSTTADGARTALGATTLGNNVFTIPNPSAITFPRFNVDNTVSSLNAADFRTAIGAGTSNTTGTVTSVDVSGGTTGLTVSGSPVTTSGTITLAGTLAVANGGTGSTTLTANNVLLGNGTSALQAVAPGTANNVLKSNGETWTSGAPFGLDVGYAELIATGSLTDGATVTVNEDGTVSVYGAAISQTVGTPAVFESASTDQIATVYDFVNNKVVIAYRDVGNSNHGTAIVGTVSGSSITFGTPVVFAAANTGGIAAVCDTFNNRIVIAYQNVASSGFGTAIVGTVSGNSISFGSPVVFNSFNTNELAAAFATDQNRVIIAFDDGGSSNFGVGIVGAVSGTSITFGTKRVFHSTNVTRISALWNPIKNRLFLLYRAPSLSDHGYAQGADISPTSFGEGTPIVYRNVGVDFMTSCFDPIRGLAVVFHRVIANNNGEGMTLDISTSTNNVSVAGSAVVYSTGGITTQRQSCAFDPVANKAVIFFRNVSNSNFGTLRTATVGSNFRLTYDTAVVFESADTTNISAVFDSSFNKIVVTYRDVGNSNFGTASVFINSGFARTNFIGFSSGAYTNGQTATIKTIGSTINNQTGLLAGKRYFVTSTGALSYTTATTEFAGTALSTTKLIVKG